MLFKCRCIINIRFTGGAVTIGSGKGSTSSGAVSISTSDGGTAGVSGNIGLTT